ncbi:sensor histidine kinase [Hymenobacter cellulosilyticus]|uniref:histidine kinase n=1 Tax=Hymenobacter cellulosilyticus TaxID=2932248 RepID=A0A8T9Q6F3_9BACT|nr:sensor histidine kinase [Hymenobacter cellulosilyticus]UOQ73144.1 sensor histidine kinase [Hymenobacter cellulosilyticus]
MLDNALKYSDNQLVLVRFGYEGAQVHIRIEDRGIGIAPTDMSHIFQPFFRADNARSVVGHGVGLPLARRIIELHGGKLLIRSRLGAGTVAEAVFSPGR